MKTMSRLSAAERRQQNVGSRASAAARGHGRACRRCDLRSAGCFCLKVKNLVIIVYISTLAARSLRFANPDLSAAYGDLRAFDQGRGHVHACQRYDMIMTVQCFQFY